MSSNSIRLPRRAWLTTVAVLIAASSFVAPTAEAHGWKGWHGWKKKQEQHFQRVATFPVFQNVCSAGDEDCISETSYAEILTTSEDGRTVIYIGKHGDDGLIGFVDITNPNNPKAAGVISGDKVGGEPTSVAVVGQYALVAVNSSADFVNTSGHLLVVDIKTRKILRKMELGGQPDSVAVSPDGRYAAIAIENERDEDLGNGEPPQMPAGYLVIVDIGAKWYHWKNKWQRPVSEWELRNVDLTGIADLFPEDPEPEYVDINEANVAVVTLQENNHIILVHLPSGKVINDFSAGSVNLTQIDATEDDVINQTESLNNVLREPDAVAWLSPLTLATANEGDLDGGSRGFSIFGVNGKVLYDSGNDLEHIIASVGHYPESRSENKGSEPEGVKYDTFGSDRFLFVGSERSSTVAVYKLDWLGRPEFHQILPGGIGPEGLATSAKRGLFMTSSEEDDRADTFRSVISIYQLKRQEPNYPTLVSEDRADGTPIPWGGLSALASDPINPTKAYTVYDSYYKENRIYVLDMSQTPPVITAEIPLTYNGKPVNMDPEGIAVRKGGGFWIASEGAGNCASVGSCSGVTSPNLLLEVDASGKVLFLHALPSSVNDIQRSNGFEGVASVGTPGVDEIVYVAFQRAWNQGADKEGKETRIGRYDPATGEWTFAYYPLDAVETTASGDWIGLSEITAVGNNTFVVIERDKQAGTDARVKRLYKFSVNGVNFLPDGNTFETVKKTLVRDVLPDLKAPNGAVIEKLEGFMVLRNGQSWIVTDNDGTDDSAGETQLINLGRNVP